MAWGRSTYPIGASQTAIGGEYADATPTHMVQALLGREMARPPAAVAPVAQPSRPRRAYTVSRPSGYSQEMPSARDGARALMGGREEGRHSFVTNIKGGPQVMGGLVSSSSGPGAVYGGWQVDESPGATRFANLPSEDGPAFGPSEDPADRAARINANLSMLERARYMPMTRR